MVFLMILAAVIMSIRLVMNRAFGRVASTCFLEDFFFHHCSSFSMPGSSSNAAGCFLDTGNRYHIDRKYLTKFQVGNIKNDKVMTSQYLRHDVENWWRHISVKSDGMVVKLRSLHFHNIAMRFAKFRHFLIASFWFIEIPSFKSRQIPMTSLVPLDDWLMKAR